MTDAVNTLACHKISLIIIELATTGKRSGGWFVGEVGYSVGTYFTLKSEL